MTIIIQSNRQNVAVYLIHDFIKSVSRYINITAHACIHACLCIKDTKNSVSLIVCIVIYNMVACNNCWIRHRDSFGLTIVIKFLTFKVQFSKIIYPLIYSAEVEEKEIISIQQDELSISLNH